MAGVAGWPGEGRSAFSTSIGCLRESKEEREKAGRRRGGKDYLYGIPSFQVEVFGIRPKLGFRFSGFAIFFCVFVVEGQGR